MVESGVMDRVRIDDGRHWIVDYKTSTHEGGNLAGFLAALVVAFPLGVLMGSFSKVKAEA